MKNQDQKLLSQAYLKEHLITRFQVAPLYKKFKSVFARKSKPGERIETITADGLETVNTANHGDFIVQNQTFAKESYIISSKKFEQRYELIKAIPGQLDEYAPVGRIRGIQITREILNLLNCKEIFYIRAPWDAPMVVKLNDYLVCPPDYSEIYRIAEKEFWETYQIDLR